MRIKLALLAAMTLVAIGSSVAIAGRHNTARPTATPKADAPVGMSCCGLGRQASAPVETKDVAAKSGMSCHATDEAAQPGAAAKPRSCCK